MKKKLAVFLIILPIFIFITLYIYFAYNPSKVLGRSYSMSEATLPASGSLDGQSDDVTDAYGSPVITADQLYMLMPVQYISQNPELPTGCEITSLAMTLNYLGFNVSKTQLAENYLDKLESFDGSFYDYFIGNPAETNGWGCFAPAIVKAANKYLADQSSSLKAYNISNSSMQTLFDELSCGRPVIVWTTSSWNTETRYTPITLNDSTFFNWPSSEHCVVLTGFNIEKSTVFLVDPLIGIVERDLTEFAKTYDAYYKQAVVIK